MRTGEWMFDYSLVDDIVDSVVDGFDPERIYIFGSVARREARDDSDVDIMLVMDTHLDRVRRTIPVRLALLRYKVDKDIIVVTPCELAEFTIDERSFYNTVLNTGVLAYDRRCGRTAIFNQSL